MEEISLKELCDYFLNKILYVILFTVFGLVIGLVYVSMIQTPLYKSTTTLVLTRTSENAESSSITSSDVTLNQKLVSTYREIIKSRRIIEQVIRNLNLDVKYEDLYDKISVTNVDDTELIRVSLSYPSAAEAAAIVDEVANVFKKEIVDIYNIENVSIIDIAIVSDEPDNISPLKTTAIGAMIGLVLSSMVIFVMFYFDTTIKSTSIVETRVGLPVLGSVPLSKSADMVVTSEPMVVIKKDNSKKPKNYKRGA